MKKIVVIVTVGVLIAAFFALEIPQYLDIHRFKLFVEQQPVLAGLAFFSIYVCVTALSLPLATALTLLAGLSLGIVWGVVVVSFASATGATIAMLLSRFVLRDAVEKRFAQAAKKINAGVEKDGKSYLFAMRLTPIFPFVAVNLCFGLTSMNARTFFWVSQLGMFPATVIYVNAGAQLGGIDNLSVGSIINGPLLFAFLMLGLFPFIAKAILSYIQSQQGLRGFKKPRSFDTNVVVIGAGAAGLVSSYISAAVKAKVTLIEKHKMGGDCLNTGCVPSKAIIRAAKLVHDTQRASAYGVSISGLDVDFEKVMTHVHRAIDDIAPHDSVERYSALGVDCVEGDAEIISPWEVRVGEQTISARAIIIASGARPYVPDTPGLSEVSYLTSENLWQLKALPKRLLIWGSGAMACEMAQAFARLGSNVVILSRGPSLLSKEDDDVAAFVEALFLTEGIELMHCATVQSFAQSDAGIRVNITANEESKPYTFDHVLLALGREGNSDQLGLKSVGISSTEKGMIEVDEFMRTRVPTIYACGDIVGPYQYTHMAAHQAWFSAVHALFSGLKLLRIFKVNYHLVPHAIFIDPEVARVGLSEKEARQKGIDYELTRYDLSELDRAITEASTQGFVKVLTVPGKDTILGATVVGAHAAETITEFVTAMKHKYGMNKLLGTIHIYPSWSEANKAVAGRWKQNHVSAKILRILERFHRKRLG